MRRPLPLVLLLATACRQDYEEFTPLPYLVFSVSDPTVTAGDEVQYLAYMDGIAEPLPTDPALASNLEPDLAWGSGVLVATFAGDHTLTASAEYNGELYTATAELAVAPGPVAFVDLELSDYETGAGEPILYSAEAWDLYGNPTAEEEIEVEVFSPDVELGPASLVSTVPGLYLATASAQGVSDTEQFVVDAGPAVSLELTLSDELLERNETTLATVLVLDAYGNEVDEDWSLWTEPTDGVVQSYNALRFGEEGWFTVLASTADGLLSDSVGPLLVDSSGPDLDVIDPPRGTRTTNAGQTVSGTVLEEWSGVSTVTVNGDAATVSGAAFSAWQDWDWGTNVLETVAVDGDGNGTTDVRALMSGAYQVYGGGVGDGLQVRITEQGFDVVESFAEGFVDTSLLESSIPSPVLNQSSKSCAFGVCVTWYSIQFYLENPSIGATDLELDPQSSGALATTARVYDLYMAYRAKGTLVGVSYSASGDISADWLELTMNLWPSVSGGQLAVTVTDAVASTQNFDFYLNSWIYDVVDFFGIDIDGIIEGYLVDAIADMAADEIPALVADAVQDLEIAQSFDIEANTYHFDAIPSSCTVDDAGLSLGLETWFTADGWVSGFSSDPGSLYADYTSPTYTSVGADMGLGLNQDFLNQALFALWGGGVLDMTLTEEALGLDMADLAIFLPELSDLTLQTVAWLPPTVVPGSGSELLDLQLGDLELSLYDGPPVESNLFLRFYVSVEAGLGLSASADNTLSAELGEVSIRFDLVHPDDRSFYAGDTEALLEALVPMILPELTGALGNIPIPSFDGYGLSGLSISLDGAESGYVVLSGSLVLGG